MMTLELPILSDNRVTLREWRQSDLSTIEEASTDPYIVDTTSVPTSYTESKGNSWLTRQQEHLNQGRGYPFAITTAHDDVAIGMIALIIGTGGRWEASYWVVPSARGGGIARDALALAADWALRQDGVDELELWIEPWNTASIRVAERTGFTFERTRSDVEYRSGRREAHVYVRRSITNEVGNVDG